MTQERPERARLDESVQRLLRESCAAEVCVHDAGGQLLARAVIATEAGVKVGDVDPAALGRFDQALWEGMNGALFLKRLPDGALLQVAFDRRSTPGLVRVRSLELVQRCYRSMDAQSTQQTGE